MSNSMYTDECEREYELFDVPDDQILETANYSEDIKEAFLEYFLLDSFQHNVLYSPKHFSDDVQHGYDPIYGFVLEKQSFESTLKVKRAITQRYELSPLFHKLEKQIKSMTAKKCLKVPTYMTQLIKYARNDPDMHYFGYYNWYYTGGTIQISGNEHNKFLLFVEKAEKESICVAPLKKNFAWHIDSSQIVKTVPCEGQEIYEVKGVSNSNLIGVRQKNNCLVYSGPQSNEKNLFQQHLKINSDIPFTSFDISPVHHELCTINVNCVLSFWDINEKGLPLNTLYVSDNSPYDKWHSLWYSNSSPSEVVVASRNTVKWTDRRSKKEGKCLELRCISGKEEDEEMSIHFESKCHPNGIYIGTNVSLLLMDMRMLEVPVHRWTHRMRLPPLYSSVVQMSEGKEIACIANHYPGDVILAFSTPDYSYPLIELPSRLDSLLTYQAQGKCLDPSLRSCLALGLSGLTTISSPGSLDAEVLTQSQTSVIFSQSLFKFDDNSGECPSSKNFSHVVTQREKLNATSRWDLSKLYESIRDRNNTHMKSNVKHTSVPAGNQKWQWNVKDLANFKDVLSSVILDEWDEVINSKNQVILNGDKVSAWLETLGSEPA